MIFRVGLLNCTEKYIPQFFFQFQVLAETFPWMQPLYDGTLENRKHWQDLAEKVDMGLTWIDHDVIEKPVEEFSGEFFQFVVDNTDI